MSDNPQAAPTLRVFKIGTTQIVEDTSTASLGNEQIRAFLKNTYPEVANATIRESTTANGTRVLEFLPVAGRKG